MVFGLAVFSFLFLIFLDEPLWSIRLFTGPWALWVSLSPLSGTAVLATFFGVWGINAWSCHTPLERMTREPWLYRPWVRSLRFLCAGFPLFGLLAVPVWRWVQETSPAWAQRRTPEPPPLFLFPRKRRPAWHSDSRAVFAGLLAGGFAAWGLLVLWVMKLALRDSSHRGETLLLSLPLRFAVFALLWAYLGSTEVRRSASPGPYRLALVASFSWLIPVPYLSIAGVLLPLAVEPSTARSQTLTWQALVRRQDAARLPLWLGLEETLRKGWQDLSLRERLWKPPRSASPPGGGQEVQVRVLKLYDLQTFALLFDASVLGWCLSWLAAHRPSWSSALSSLFQFLWMGSLVLCGVAVCLAVFHLALVLLRTSGALRVLDRQPYARYLASTQLALGAGLLSGLWVHQGRAKEIGLLMMQVCGLLASLVGLFMMHRTLLQETPLTRRRRDIVLDVGFLFALMPIFGLGGPLGLLPKIFLVWAVLSPVRAWLLGRTLLPWLLRPFAWRDLSARDLPAALRWRLRALAAAALLPGGGLAIPLCIWIRHRRWPEAAALAWRRQIS
jgi:hypothetical protein